MFLSQVFVKMALQWWQSGSDSQKLCERKRECRFCSRREERKNRAHIYNFCYVSLYYILVFSVVYPYPSFLITFDLKKFCGYYFLFCNKKNPLDSLLLSPNQEQCCFSHNEFNWRDWNSKHIKKNPQKSLIVIPRKKNLRCLCLVILRQMVLQPELQGNRK